MTEKADMEASTIMEEPTAPGALLKSCVNCQEPDRTLLAGFLRPIRPDGEPERFVLCFRCVECLALGRMVEFQERFTRRAERPTPEPKPLGQIEREWRSARPFPCPVCGAQPGADCRQMRGKRAGNVAPRPHIGRLQAAQEAALTAVSA